MSDTPQTEIAANTDPPSVPTGEGFSLVLGGPLYQLLLRAKLVQPSMALIHRRMIAAILITWMPLAALTLLAGSFAGNAASVPFLFDVDVHVKFLFSLPLLIGAELIVHRRVRGLVEQFVDHELIAPEDRPRFDAAIARAIRLRNSMVVEVVILGISIFAWYWIWRSQVVLAGQTWYADSAEGSLTRAGYWYAFISLPLGRFILLRWYYRLFIWYLFLWQVSRLRLMLNPLHPDRAGGLGFLELSVNAFAPILIAQSAFLAGAIGNEILHAGRQLPFYQVDIVVALVILMLTVLLPLLFFTLPLIEAKLTGERQMGKLASRYANEFRRKWLQGSLIPDERLLGTSDVQSLADLANSYEVVHSMRLVPFGLRTLVSLAVVIALPILPLVLTMIPIEELLQRLLKLLT